MIEAQEGHLILDADGLLSKWGYCDGDIVIEWWDEQFDGEIPQDLLDHVDHHAVLSDLVRTHLVPVIIEAGHTIEVYDIQSIHNPIRARILDGVEVEPSLANRQIFPPLSVMLPPALVWAAVERIRAASTSGKEDDW